MSFRAKRRIFPVLRPTCQRDLCKPNIRPLSRLPTIDGKALMRANILFPITALALLTALLLPLLGPLADHHFAERQPAHLHVYLAGVPVKHLHDHEAFHPHESTNVDSWDVENAGSVLENSVIFMPQEGEGLSVSTLGVTLALLTSVVALVLPTVLRLLTPRGQRALRGIITSPEPPPPRLAL